MSLSSGDSPSTLAVPPGEGQGEKVNVGRRWAPAAAGIRTPSKQGGGADGVRNGHRYVLLFHVQ